MEVIIIQQYYIGKKEASIEELKSSKETIANSLFINDSLNKKCDHSYKHIELERCTLSKISFNDVSLTHISFSHCTFIECYFNKAQLSKVAFNNCTFIKCYFNKIKLSDCSFFYTEWENNYIKFNELYNCLPLRYNNRSRLCKVMAKSCLEDGNLKEYRKYFFEQIHSRENHYKEIILRRDEFYQTYTIGDVVVNILKLITSKISGLIWGYGEKISNIIYSSMFIVLLYSLIYLKSSNIMLLESDKYITSLYVSLCNFLTISCDITFSDTFFRYATAIEGFIGIAFMGLFVTSLFKNINTR